MQWQVIFANPCQWIKAPKADASEPRYLDEHEAAHLLELVEKEDVRFRTAIQPLLSTGLRRSELCGLEWPDIDFETEVLYVRRRSLYLPDRGIFTDEAKNESSVRAAKMPTVAMEIMRSYKAWQTEQRLQVGDQWVDSPGHATPATTMKVYAHAIQSADESAAQTLQNLLAPGANRKQAK